MRSILTQIDRMFGHEASRQGGFAKQWQLADRCAPVHLSRYQELCWSPRQLGRGRIPNTYIAILFSGTLNEHLLWKSIEIVYGRHNSLRTTFGKADGVLIQNTRSASTLSRHVDSVESNIGVQAICSEERDYNFSIHSDSMSRFRLVQNTSDGNSILTISLHKSIADSFSLGLLLNEILLLYGMSRARAGPEPLPKLPIQYIDFAYSQGFMANKLNAQLDYWRAQLAELPLVVNLPLRRRVLHGRYNYRTEQLTLSDQLTSKLTNLGSNLDVTTFMVLVSAFFILLARYSGQTDIALVVPFSNRKAKETSRLIGLFENFMMLRTDLSGNPTFIDFIAQNQRTVSQAHDYLDVPFEDIFQAVSGISRPSGLSPFRLVFGSSEGPIDNLAFDHLAVSEYACPDTPIDNLQDYDLKVGLRTANSGLLVELNYRLDMFDIEIASTILPHYEHLLESVTVAPHLTIDQYEFLSDQERLVQLQTWNHTKLPCQENAEVQVLFEAQAAKVPSKVALFCGKGYVSYDILNKRANQLAHYLVSKGVEEDTLIGLCLPRSIDFVIGALGIIKAGCAYVPIDPTFPSDRKNYIIVDSCVKMIVAHSSLRREIDRLTVHAIWLDQDTDSSNEENVLSKQETINLKRECQTIAARLAYFIYTSGSTGQPKGVGGLHRSIINRVAWAEDRFPIQDGEVFCLRANVGFVDHVAEIFQPLLIGGTLAVVADPDLNVYDHTSLITTLRKFEVSRLTITPSALSNFLGCKPHVNLVALKYIFCSGDVLTVNLAGEFFARFANVRLINIYGATEIGADASYYEVRPSNYLDIATYFRPRRDQLTANLGIGQGGLSARPESFEITKPNIDLEKLKKKFMDVDIPDMPASLNQYVSELKRNVFPFLINVSSQLFIGHMTSALPNFVPDFSRLVSQLNQNMVKIETSKALTFLERQVLAMMHKLFFERSKQFYALRCQDPGHVFGVVTSGGSTANITALWCARNRGLMALGISKRDLSDFGASQMLHKAGRSKAVIIASQLAHYSVRKAASILGIGEKNILLVGQDSRQKVSIRALERIILKCHAEGNFIIAIIGVAGATETGVVDPLAKMGRVAAKHNVHFHVDAAWGGAFMFSDKYRDILSGIESADTITFCAHKQMFAPQGISLCLYKDSLAAHATSIHADYQANEGSFDLGQYSLEGSRPAVSFLLHSILYLLSKKGLASLIEQGMEKVIWFRALVEDHYAFELIGDPEINILNYRYIPLSLRSQKRPYSEKENLLISKAVDIIQGRQFLDGKTFVSKTRIADKRYAESKISVFRVVLSNPLTTYADLRHVLDDQVAVANACFEGPCRETPPSSFTISGKAPFMDGAGELCVPIGKPIANTRIYILNRNRQLVPVGVVGEIYVAGLCMSVGYLMLPSLSREMFVCNPFDGGTMYRTGDLGRFRSDGNIEFIGRTDQQIKIHGVRLELHEIEWHVSQLGGVATCIVTAHEDGRGEKQLVGYVVRDKNAVFAGTVSTSEEIREELRKRVPFDFVPEVFYFLDELPVMRNGKLDWQRLSQIEVCGPST